MGFSFVTCFPQLLPLLFLCLQLWLLIFTSRVTEAISDANSSALAGKTKQKKPRKAPAGPLACRRSCEDRLPVNSASWKSVLQWQGLLLMILHVTSFPVHPNSLLDQPFCSTKWILALQHSWWGSRSVGKTWQCCFPETVSLCCCCCLLCPCCCCTGAIRVVGKKKEKKKKGRILPMPCVCVCYGCGAEIKPRHLVHSWQESNHKKGCDPTGRHLHVVLL